MVPFDFHRSRPVLPDALDFGHAKTQSADRQGILLRLSASVSDAIASSSPSKRSWQEADSEIVKTFAAHKCKPMDSSQNALRIVRESTEDK